MPFWQDCIGCSGDCVGEVETGEIDYWFIGPGTRAAQHPDTDTPVFDGANLSDVAVGDILTVVGTPQFLYTYGSGSTAGAGCGLPGCTDPYPAPWMDNYITLPGSADVVPASPWCPDGGVLVPDDGTAWSAGQGGNGMTFVVAGTGGSGDDAGFTFEAETMNSLCTAIFGALGEITNAIAYFMLHNARSGATYGVLTSYSCSCL